jgi:hypothetical protein
LPEEGPRPARRAVAQSVAGPASRCSKASRTFDADMYANSQAHSVNPNAARHSELERRTEANSLDPARAIP